VTRPIVFCTDYGLEDEFVGVCHGVIARITPDALVIDLTHGIPPRDVLAGACALENAVGFVPEDAVFLAVVDPGVGTSRMSVAVESASGILLVGPDNGLLSLAWQALGGVRRAFEILNQDLMLRPVSATFHGRDVFAPVAAHLARGTAPDAVGERLPAESLVTVVVPRPRVVDGELRCTVRAVDRFGNVQLEAGEEDLEGARFGSVGGLRATAGERAATLRRVRTFAEGSPEETVLLVDSTGRLKIAVNGGSAAQTLDAAPGGVVALAPVG
jgi:S-adenosylmethionine hydrolase